MANRVSQDWKILAAMAKFRTRELAVLTGISGRQLQRIFHRQFSRTPQQWLNEQMVLAAQQLLLNGHPVKSVAFELGFKQASHFCRQFKSNSQPSHRNLKKRLEIS